MRGSLFLASFFAAFLFAGAAHAQEAVTFPITELGGCASKQECKAYCDKSENAEACVAFGEKRGLIKKEEAEKARLVLQKPGPGGCKGLECRSYCADPSHKEACAAFAKENGLMRAENVKFIRLKVQVDAGADEKIRTVLERKAGPGGCTSREECKAFCAKEENVETCMKFAKEEGIVSSEEARRVESFQASLKAGGGPGGCADTQSCRAYCAIETNAAECRTFAEEKGFARLKGNAADAEHRVLMMDPARGEGVKIIRERLTPEKVQALCEEDPASCERLKQGLKPQTRIPEDGQDMLKPRPVPEEAQKMRERMMQAEPAKPRILPQLFERPMKAPPQDSAAAPAVN